jgi:NAD(P)-dependent dehydrogenase (short-subunit alcohol dehydrogenase family)
VHGFVLKGRWRYLEHDWEATLDASVAVKQADVTSPESVDAALPPLERLDIVFNCAGIIQRGAEHDLAVFEKVLAVIVVGTAPDLVPTLFTRTPITMPVVTKAGIDPVYFGVEPG